MLLIIAFHATRNGFLSLTQPVIVYISAVVLGSWGILGVDLFLMISAWFLCEQSFRLKKVISIVFQTFSWVVL
jgi:peptidoglycan/LPS O-acetylase OafA/YrhL